VSQHVIFQSPKIMAEPCNSVQSTRHIVRNPLHENMYNFFSLIFIIEKILFYVYIFEQG